MYQAEIHEKEEAGGREGEYLVSPSGLCSELPEFPESHSKSDSLKNWQVAIALGINFFSLLLVLQLIS